MKNTLSLIKYKINENIILLPVIGFTGLSLLLTLSAISKIKKNKKDF